MRVGKNVLCMALYPKNIQGQQRSLKIILEIEVEDTETGKGNGEMERKLNRDKEA